MELEFALRLENKELIMDISRTDTGAVLKTYNCPTGARPIIVLRVLAQAVRETLAPYHYYYRLSRNSKDMVLSRLERGVPDIRRITLDFDADVTSLNELLAILPVNPRFLQD
jgi:hypothetical protein